MSERGKKPVMHSKRSHLHTKRNLTRCYEKRTEAVDTFVRPEKTEPDLILYVSVVDFGIINVHQVQ